MVYNIRYKNDKLIVYKSTSSGFVISVLGQRRLIKGHDVLLLNFKSFFKYMSIGSKFKLNRSLIHLFSTKLGISL
jgi:hypothetical protein